MKTQLLNKFFLFTFISLLGIYQINAQDRNFTFDGTGAGSWEDWTPGGGTGAWSSVFANDPGGDLDITYHATTKNAIMYRPAADLIDATTLKYFEIKVRNESSQINRVIIRTKNGAAGWKFIINAPITDDTALPAGTYSTYAFDLSMENPTEWTGDIRYQVAFRKDDVSEITDGGTVYVDNILFSANTTLSTQKSKTLEGVSIYPNPASGFVNVSSLNGGDISVYSILGARVLNENTTSRNYQLNVSSLKSGMYLLKIVSDNKSSTKKLIIN